MMPSDRALADLCAEAYAAFDKPTWCVDAVRAFRYAYPDFTAIIFPGSVTPLDWARDFLALDFHPEIEHADLGVVPLGFWLGLETVLAQISAEVGDKPLVLGGHSLGGARALLAAGLLAAQNRPPAHVAAFAPPRVGSLKGLLSGLPCAAYRYRDDPVPLVPFSFPRALALVQLVPPTLELDVWADHHLANYQAEAPAAV